MRGSAGVGKSTYIKEHNLEQYKLCADDIRLLIQSPILTVEGNLAISQKNDKRVWELLFEMLEDRMKRGEFTIVDATNSKTSEMSRYKKLADKYRYRMFIIDMTDVPIEITKERNRQREEHKRVPDDVIDKMYSRFKTQKIPNSIMPVKPEDFDEKIKNIYSIKDFSYYDKIHFIGDIHGCYTVLMEYLKDGLKDNELYIFLGDYLDRGIENAEVMEFILNIYEKSNVILLTGNHEEHIYNYAHNLGGVSKEFELNTRPQLISANFNKKDIRQLYRKFAQFAYFTYYEKTVLVTHGGLSKIPENFVFIPTTQLIKGVGDYNDMEKVNESFLKNTSDNTYQVHGHRNNSSSPTKINDRCFNLCGGAEFGGYLRVVTLSKEGFIFHEIKNNVFKEFKQDTTNLSDISIEKLIQLMRDNKFVYEKKFFNISSFNFSRDAFFDKVWFDLTTKARGLFINTKTNEIVARSYDKFFNMNETKSTRLKEMQNSLKYPLSAFVKYNGYLGIVGYDKEIDDLLITTKSSILGDYNESFKRILFNKMRNPELLKPYLKKFLKDKNLSLIFEVIDPINDPHMIEYQQEDVILLDAVYRTIDYKKLSYENLQEIGKSFNFIVKEKVKEFSSWNEFYNWQEEVKTENYKYNDEYIEGFVIEDINGFMFKMKLAYYNNWKHMRNVKDSVARYGFYKNTSSLITEEQNQFYGWLRELSKEDLRKDIITLRKKFYEENFKIKDELK